MSSTPQSPQQPSPNPIDLAKQAATAPVAQLKEEAISLLAAKKVELATAEQEARTATNRHYAIQQEVQELERTIASYNTLAAKIAGAKVADPRPSTTCVV